MTCTCDGRQSGAFMSFMGLCTSRNPSELWQTLHAVGTSVHMDTDLYMSTEQSIHSIQFRRD